MEELREWCNNWCPPFNSKTLHSNTEEINITEEHNTEEHTMDNNRESQTRIKHQLTTTSSNNSKEDQLQTEIGESSSVVEVDNLDT